MSGGGPANTSYSPEDDLPVKGVTLGATTAVGVDEQPVVADGTVYSTVDPKPTQLEPGYRHRDDQGRIRARPIGSSSVSWERSFEADLLNPPAVSDSVTVVTHWDGTVRALDTDSGETLWSKDPDLSIPFPPVIADERVFVASDSDPTTLIALALDTGAVQWQETGGQIMASRPAVRDGVVYEGFDDFTAFEADTGETKWVNEEIEVSWLPPLVTEDTLLVIETSASWPPVVQAVDPADGTIRWSSKLDAEMQAAVATDGEAIYVGQMDHTVAKIDLASGDQLWTVETVGHVTDEVAVSDQAVYATCDQELCYAFDPEDGTELWRARFRDRAGLALAEGSLFAGTPAGLTRLDPGSKDFVTADSSEEVTADWRVRTDVHTGSRLARNEEGMYFTDEYGTVYAYRRDGQDNWVADEFRYDLSSDPVAVGDRVIVCTDNAHVEGLDATSGTHAWDIEVGATVRTQLVVGEGQVVLAAEDTLISLDPVTGDTNWTHTLPESVSELWGFDDETLYLRTDKTIRTFSMAGEPGWEATASDLDYAQSMAADENRVYVGGHYGMVALNAADGSQTWAHQRDEPIFGGLTTDGDTVYAGDIGGILFALDATDGTQRWSLETDAEFRSKGVIQEEMFVIGNEAERLLFVERASGQLMASYDATAPITAQPATGEDRVFALDGHGTLHAVSLPTPEPVTTTATKTPTPSPTDDTTTTDFSGNETATITAETSTTNTDGPGFGVLTGIAGLLGAGALRQRDRED